jgi:hypothetical protein
MIITASSHVRKRLNRKHNPQLNQALRRGSISNRLWNIFNFSLLEFLKGLCFLYLIMLHNKYTIFRKLFINKITIWDSNLKMWKCFLCWFPSNCWRQRTNLDVAHTTSSNLFLFVFYFICLIVISVIFVPCRGRINILK